VRASIGKALDSWADRRVALKQAREHLDLQPLLAGLPAPVTSLTCVVFSKDRAMQLDACLRSIESYAPYTGPIVVVYAASTTRFAEGYERLEHSDRVRLALQGSDLKTDVLAAIDAAVGWTTFHTDDDVFFRSPPGPPELPDGFAAFSFRLGLNTDHCYPLGERQNIPDVVRSGSLIAWDWTRATLDFAYPLSLNGHVFRTETIKALVERARFSNPNELESWLHRTRHTLPAGMLAFTESSLVTLPMNAVAVTGNRAGSDPSLAPDVLNERFLAGERIDLERMDFSSVHAAHEEIAVTFTGCTDSARPTKCQSTE
jgi:hypothetical protein